MKTPEGVIEFAVPQVSDTATLHSAKALISAGQKDAARKELAKLGNNFPAQAEVAQLKSRL